MGFKQSYICPICNYETVTSAGPDRGFRTSTNTYVCLDCKTINDLRIDPLGITEENLKISDYEEWRAIMCDDRYWLDYDDPEENEREKQKLEEEKKLSYDEWRKKREAHIASFHRTCHDCGSTNLELWDNKKKPCPKCGTSLQIDPDGFRVNWD